MPTRWCTVTVIDAQGRRRSVDVLASSTFDAAHPYLTHARGHPDAGLPVPGKDTPFEVVTAGKVYTARGRSAATMDRQTPRDVERSEGYALQPAPGHRIEFVSAPIRCNVVHLHHMKKPRKTGTTPSPRISVTFPSDLYQTLTDLAKKKKVSVAWIVREAAEKHVADQWPLFGGPKSA